MNTSDTLNKANSLNPAEDYKKLRREGILNIEKLAGNVWTDYNTHDPGITMLEALCYAITDLAYRTGFDMKDLLAQNTLDSIAWKNIFYTAREILPCNPVTLNDFRKILIDVAGVRNAWITISKDYEVPIFLNKDKIIDAFKNQDLVDKIKSIQPCDCDDKVMLPYTSDTENQDIRGLNFSDGAIVELNGLYKIIIEYEEEILEKKREDEVRKKALKVLHSHRNVCEDYLSVSGAEYKDFFLKSSVSLAENADADRVLAEMCYRIQNYFTPPVKFYTLDEMTGKGILTDEIFEGPILKHGFILEKELEKTDMFRDMRLSDIINFISDIEGVNSLRTFKMIDDPGEPGEEVEADNNCSSEDYFDEWIERIKNEKLVGRISVDDLVKFLQPTEEDPSIPFSEVHFFKPSGEVLINSDRFLKLLNDLKGKDKYLKMAGFVNNFPVPTGENMELKDFYPVQYELPFTYRVDESGLPVHDGKKRLIQSLQLKGYFAVFEQLFLNYLFTLGDLNEIFSFKDIKFKGETEHKNEQSACDKREINEGQEQEFIEPLPNQIIYKDEQNILLEKIAGYKCLYYDAEKYISELQGIIQPEAEFERQRNQMLDHLLARFNEEMTEYGTLMKSMYPDNYLIRIIRNKADLLSDYRAISNYRARAYNYKLEEECRDYENEDWDEERIALNISGLEKRIARLIGLHDYKRKDLAPENLFFEKMDDDQNPNFGKIKLVLYEDNSKESILLETGYYEGKCSDEILHCFVNSGCCSHNFIKYPEQRSTHKRVHRHNQMEELRFALLYKEGKELAISPVYRNSKLRDEALQRAECILEKICHTEGLHMVENILLRPKGDNQLSNEKNELVGEEFKLLNICLDKCDLHVKQDAKARPNYKFDLQVLPPEKCLDGKRWNVILNRLDPAAKVLEHQFKEYELASDFISRVREYGSELENYSIYKTHSRETPAYYFKLKDDKGKTLVESSCFSMYSTTSAKSDEALPGKRIDCNGTIIDKAIVEEIEELKKFLAFELDLYCCEESCDHDEDPYSFRLTFVLPCWPKRFHNKSFRKFVEKTIHSETPAHIQARIFWLGLTEMRNFEESYFEWLIEMSCNDVPDIAICNTLIDEVIHLKNCDDKCQEEENSSKQEMNVSANAKDQPATIPAEIKPGAVREKPAAVKKTGSTVVKKTSVVKKDAGKGIPK